MATILEGLNKLSGKLGGAETATENLEALNAIAGALGGETNATNNADAIDQIAEHASGGGGGTVPKVNIKIKETKGAKVTIGIMFVKPSGTLDRGNQSISANGTLNIAIPSAGGAGFTEFSIISDGGSAREPEVASGTGFVTLNYGKNSATVQGATVTSALEGLEINI